MVEVNINGKAARFAVDFGFAGDRGHQVGAAQVDGGRSTAMAIVDGARGARIHVDAEHRHLRVLVDTLGNILLRLRVGSVSRRGIHRRSRILLGEGWNGES